MRDESGECSWSMQVAPKPNAEVVQDLLQPVRSRFDFSGKAEQVGYLKKKLRHIERKDAASSD